MWVHEVGAGAAMLMAIGIGWRVFRWVDEQIQPEDELIGCRAMGAGCLAAITAAAAVLGVAVAIISLI